MRASRQIDSGEARKAEDLPACIHSTVLILGDKWTPLLIHAMAGGPMRFCQLQHAVGGVNPRTLSSRLSFLEAEGIVTKATFSAIPPHTEYALAPKGRDLLPIIRAMGEWSSKYAEISRGAPVAAAPPRAGS